MLIAQCSIIRRPMSCRHYAWVAASKSSDVVLWDCGRVSRVLRELTNPSFQRPSTLLFVGRRTKDIALRELFPWNNLKYPRRDGIATLRLDNATSQADFPTLFAESDPLRVEAQDDATAICHETTAFPAQWQLPAGQSLYDVVHARILCLFTDVLCLFVDDFEDFEDAVLRLCAWSSLGRATTQFPRVRPRVILVKNGVEPGPSSSYDLLEADRLRDQLKEGFASITVLLLADEQISPPSRYRRLKELIQRRADESRHVKQSVGCLYTASHLDCFFRLSIRHTARSITEPFNFVAASRSYNPLNSEFAEHVGRFLRVQPPLSLREKTTHIASAILMDAYPPGMHCKFHSPAGAFAR